MAVNYSKSTDSSFYLLSVLAIKTNQNLPLTHTMVPMEIYKILLLFSAKLRYKRWFLFQQTLLVARLTYPAWPYFTLSFLILFVKLVSAIFWQIFIFSPNDSPLKTMKNVFISSKKLFSFSRYSTFCNF